LSTLALYEPVTFDRLRQSRLATFDRCALSSRFEHELEASGWSSLPASRGRLTHRVLARCLIAMHDAHKQGPEAPGQSGVAFDGSGEKVAIDEEAALGIFYTELREHGIDRRCGRCGAPARLEPAGEYLIDDIVAFAPARIVCQRGHSHPSDASNLPVEEALDVKWIVKKFAIDNTFNIADLVDVEQRIGATLEYPHELADPDPTLERTARYLTGQLDALFIVGEAVDHAIVLDWKDTWSLPAPSEVGFDGYFQQQFYGWLVLRNYPTVQRVTLREMYVRKSEYREADVYREDLPRIEAMLAALAERFDRAYTTGNFPPSPGQHCGWCPKPDKCPIFPEARRGGGKIETAEQAELWARERVVAQRVVEDRDRELHPWAGRMGPIPISDHKGPRVLGFRDHHRTSRPKREDLKIALRLIGVQMSERDLDRLYRTTKITKFEQHPPGPNTHRAEAERDERLMDALRASVGR
jgi:hypothetical protein